VQQRIAASGALGAPAGLGLLLAAPTIASHGSREQIDRYVGDIVTGRQAWCQLFSEPSAGSDLAGLQTRAVKDGDEWIVNGQKVWTSGGQYADLGMLLARTEPDVPKHQGITYFAFPMHQGGVEVRPLREMTGRALFNEVFLTDARVGDDAVIGGVNHGWAVANTTLMNERAGLGAGAGSPMGTGALPGTVAGYLDRRAGDFAGQASRRTGSKGAGSNGSNGSNGAGSNGSSESRASGDGESGVLSLMSAGSQLLTTLARDTGASSDPMVRQDLARLYTLAELGRFNSLRLKAVKESGSDIPGMPNIAKLSMSQIVRLTRDLGLRIIGAGGMLHAYDEDSRQRLIEATGKPLNTMVTELALLSPAPSIYGGTDQIQRNIIGERVLGLPKEPGVDRATPFSELAKNT
jgi:alkylation response protein AidB-like acyl-CoA dehydrogenase